MTHTARRPPHRHPVDALRDVWLLVRERLVGHLLHVAFHTRHEACHQGPCRVQGLEVRSRVLLRSLLRLLTRPFAFSSQLRLLSRLPARPGGDDH